MSGNRNKWLKWRSEDMAPTVKGRWESGGKTPTAEARGLGTELLGIFTIS